MGCDESNEGQGHEVGSANAVPGHRLCGGDQWFEEQASERCRRVSLQCCLRRNQEERKLQACRHVELEVEEEARNSSKEGHQPFHQGALRVQSQACLKDRAGTCHEEAEGGFELNFQMIAHYEAWVGGPAEFLLLPLSVRIMFVIIWWN